MMQPGPNLFAPEIEIERREISHNIDCGNNHKHSQHAIPYNPIIDDPSPDPCDEGFQGGDCDHKFNRELEEIVRKISEGVTCAKYLHPYDNPMSNS